MNCATLSGVNRSGDLRWLGLVAAVILPIAASAQPAARGTPSLQGPPHGSHVINVEGESLAGTGKTLLPGGSGALSIQPMAGFGSGWSGNAQALWTGGMPGAVLDLVVDVDVAATYAVEIYLTRGPDYGQVKVQVDGRDSVLTFSGYAPKPMPGGPQQAGKFPLEAGPRKVSFLLLQKLPQSSGNLVGIDRIRLYPVGPPQPAAPVAASTPSQAGATSSAKPGAPGMGLRTSLEMWDGLGRVDNRREYTTSPILIDRTRTDLLWWFRGSTTAGGVKGAVLQALREKPGPGAPALSPPGLIGQRTIPKEAVLGTAPIEFQVDIRAWATAKESQRQRGAAAPARSKPGGSPGHPEVHFFVRVLPLDVTGQPAGPPSDAIEVTVGDLPAQTPLTITPEMQGVPEVAFVAASPGQPDVWEGWCRVVASTDMPQLAVKKGTPSNRCQSGSSFDPTQLVTAFAKTLELTADFVSGVYNGAQGAIVGAVTSALKSSGIGCGGWCQAALKTGLTYAMASVGMPPSLPDFDQLMSEGEDYLVGQVAQELASKSPVPMTEEVAKAAGKAALEEFKKALKKGDGTLWVPDPKYQYRPLVLVVRASARMQASGDVTIRLSEVDGAHFLPAELKLHPMAKATSVRIPVTLVPNPFTPPHGWQKIYPLALDVDSKCGSWFEIQHAMDQSAAPSGSPEWEKLQAKQAKYQTCAKAVQDAHYAQLMKSKAVLEAWTAKFTKGAVTFRIDAVRQNSGASQSATLTCASALAGCPLPLPLTRGRAP